MSDYQPQYQPGNGWPAQPPAGGPGGYGGRTTYSPQAARPPRRRHRGAIALLVVVILILVVAGVGDQVARVYAQNRAATQLQSSLQLSAKPSVHIGGWPFTTQVLGHDLKQVDVTGTNETTKSSKLAFDFTATATGVHLNSSFSNATADHLRVQALLPFSSVDTEVGGAATLSADPAAGPNGIKLSLGVAGSLSGTVRKSGSSDIAIKFNSASGLASLFGGASGQTYNITLPKLAKGVELSSVNVTSQGIIAIFTASNAGNSQLEI